VKLDRCIDDPLTGVVAFICSSLQLVLARHLSFMIRDVSRTLDTVAGAE
jgi:hypothetical protein